MLKLASFLTYETMGALKGFLEGFRYTEEEEYLLRKLRKKEKLGYSTVRQINELLRRGQYPPILLIRFFRGLRSAISSALKKDQPTK